MSLHMTLRIVTKVVQGTRLKRLVRKRYSRILYKNMKNHAAVICALTSGPSGTSNTEKRA